MTFVRAMAQPLAISDADLLGRVLAPEVNATVTIVIASEDRVIRSNNIRNFLEPFQDQLSVVEMEGLGHDPFEEDAEAFVQVMEEVLEKEKSRILGPNGN